MNAEEILLTILGRDEATPVISQIGQNAQSTFSGMKGMADDSASSFADSYMDAIGSVSTAMSQLNVGMMSLNSVNHQIMGSLGAMKSASEYVFGTTAKAETNKVLVRGWGDAQTSWEDLYNTVDKVTDSSLTSMQDLIPAMNAFRAATGATGTELKESVAENMAQFGAYVLSLTGSEALAHTAMSDLSKGIKGRWASLDQYGISEEALKNTGKWSGEEDDIKGYMEAVREISGAVEELMNTSQGADALLGKMWSRAGKRIGNEYLPQITSLKTAFMELDDSMDGQLSTNILAMSLAIEYLSGGLYKFSTLLNGFRDISRVIYTAGQWLGFFGGQMTLAEEQAYYNAMAQQQNTQEIDNNTMARYDNIDAMYQQAEAMNILNDSIGVNNSTTATNSLIQEASPVANQGRVVGDVSGLGLDYYQDLAEAHPNANFMPSRKEYDAMIESIEKAPRLSTDPSERIKQISELTDYATRENSELRHYASVLNNNPEDLHTVNEILKDYSKESSQLETDIANVKETIFKMEVFNEGVDEGIIDAPKWDINPLRESLEELNKGSEAILDQKEQLYDIAKNKGDVPLADVIDDIRLNNVLDKVDTSKITADDEASKTLSQALKQKSKLLKDRLGSALDSIKSVPTTLSGKITGLGASLKGIPDRISDAFKGLTGSEGKIKGALDKLDHALYNPFRDKSKMKVPEIDLGEDAKGIKKVVQGGEAVAEAGATAGAVAPAMTEASAGLSFMGLAEMGLAGAFTTLIVPTLAIAGVIAILIPIIAGLVIEIMFFLKIIQQFFMSMNFGSVDMTESIEGIKQLATALGYVALAMGALLAINIVTTIMAPLMAIGNLFGGGMTGLLDTAIKSIKEAGEKLKELSEVEIDPNIAENMRSVADTLNSVSTAMMSLAGIQITTGITGFLENIIGLGSVGEALDSAKNDIIEASKHLQDFAEVTPIDEETANRIQNVCNTLGSVGDAFSGLQKIRDAKNFDIMGALGGLFGGVDIGQALTDAKKDIVDASQVLSEFSDVEPVDEGLAENIKNVASALGTVGEAISSLQSLRDTFNGANMEGMDINLSVGGFTLFEQKIPSVLEALRSTRNTIITASKGLMSFQDMPDIKGLGIGAKIKAFTKTLSSISSAVDGMKNVRNLSRGGGFDDKSNIAQEIAKVRRNIITVGKGLTSFESMPDIRGSGISSKIKAVSKALTSIGNAVNEMKNVKSLAKGQDLGGIANKIREVRRTIITVSQGLNGMAKDPNFQSIDASVVTNIKSVTKALGSLKGATSNLTSFPKTPDNVKDKIKKGVDAIKDSASELKNVTGESKVSSGVSKNIKTVSVATGQLKQSVAVLKTMPNTNANTIKNRVKNGVDAVKKASTELKKLKSGDKASNISGILNSVKNALNQLKKTLNETKGFDTAGKGIGTSLKTGMKQGLEGLTGIVTTAVTNAGNQGKAYAYTYGQGMGSRLTSGFKAQLKLSTAMSSEMDAVNTAVKNGIEKAKSSASQGASEVVQAFKDGINAKSPGDIAKTMRDEMGYTSQFIRTYGAGPVQAVGQVAHRMVKNFNPTLHNNVDADKVRGRVNSLNDMKNRSAYNLPPRPVSIHIGEGAVQLDARNLTTRESRQVMINAIEGLEMVSSVQLKGNKTK